MTPLSSPVNLSRSLVAAAALLALGLGACEKDPISETVLTEIPAADTVIQVQAPVVARIASGRAAGTQLPVSTTGGILVECVTINFPFELTGDGTRYAVADSSWLYDLLSGPLAGAEFVDFVYPLSVTLDNGTAAAVPDGDELSRLIGDCIPDSGWGANATPAFFFDDPACLTLVYPVDLALGDGTTVTAADAQTFLDLVTAQAAIYFTFPLSVLDETGAALTLADEAALVGALTSCSHGGGSSGGDDFSFLLGGDCFDYVFPLDYRLPDGTPAQLADEDAFIQSFIDGSFGDFAYPFEVVRLATGATQVIATPDDLGALFVECTFIPSGELLSVTQMLAELAFANCVQLVYPFSATAFGDASDTIVFADEQALASFVATGDGFVVFPFDITVDGVRRDVLDGLDLRSAIGECDPIGGYYVPAVLFIELGFNTDFACYSLTYPFLVAELTDVITIANEAEARAYLDAGGPGSVIFPVDVIDPVTGDEIYLGEPNDFATLLNDCQ